MSRQRVAIVGSGVAGLTAAWIISRSADVTLFEADARLGGHADTHDVHLGGRHIAVDTGFIVHNERTYPVLLRLFDELSVTTRPSEMSLSIRDDAAGTQWAGALGLRGLFPSPRMLVRPSHLRMLTEIPRFHRRAKRLIRSPDRRQTLAEFMVAGGFSEPFRRQFMEPLVAAVWSCDPAIALEYPAAYLFSFLDHHGMLRVFGSPQWRTIVGGSRTYVEQIAAGVCDVRAGTKVTTVLENGTDVAVTDGSGTTTRFDAAVIATHPSQALDLLGSPTVVQHEVLSELRYSSNEALLHTDESILPTTGNARAAWNFLRRRDDDEGMTVTYDLSRLQGLETSEPLLLTLGGSDLVDPARTLERIEYEHPIYTPASVAAQARLAELNTARVAFAGAYHGWGFHEDGARSGQAAADHLGFSWGPQTGTFATTIRHTRRAPFARTFENHSHVSVVDVDEVPNHGRRAFALGSFEARDHLGDPHRSLRENVVAYLAESRIQLAGGRILLATQPRAWGHCFNPISVFWCFDASGALAATIVEVHNTYGDRHAYLLEHRRPRTSRGRQGHVRLAVPRHGWHLRGGGAHSGPPPPHRRIPAQRRRRGVQRIARRHAGAWPEVARCPGVTVRLDSDPHTRNLALVTPPTHPAASTPPSIRSEPVTETLIATRWPELAYPKPGLRTSAGAAVAGRLFRLAVQRLNVTVELQWTEGTEVIGRGGPAAVVRDPEEFFSRLGRDGLIGFGEAYLTGAWDSDDLVGFLTVLAARMGSLIPPRWQRLRAIGVRRMPRTYRNTRAGSRSNIAHHYDLSNEMFALFLDPTMTYSAALFDAEFTGTATHRVEAGPPRGVHEPDALQRAQERKIDRLLDEAHVGPGTRLLEIGTGWGELAIRAARRGAIVRTITLSTEQRDLAERRIAEAGLTNRAAVELCDYRDVAGTFDAVISVEMIEAVGWQYWRAYFDRIDSVLVPGGRFALQAITMPHDRMLASRRTHTWITKYIFPGGALPSVGVIEDVTRTRTSLRLVNRLDLGLHYAVTLRLWDETFAAAADAVLGLGMDETFRRMWHFYLAYCEAGFAARYIDNNQLTFVKESPQ